MKRRAAWVCGPLAAAGVVLCAAQGRADEAPSRAARIYDAASPQVGRAPRGPQGPPVPIFRPEILPLAERGSPRLSAAFLAGAQHDDAVACPGDMVAVEGDYCPYVEQRCIRWIDFKSAMRCAEFAPSAPCRMKTTHKKFCIDRYEWPNRAGAIPQYMTSWKEARAACNAVGKRLCTDSEWTLACEGPERLPYPYGLKRDANACNIDKPHDFPDPVKVYDEKTQAAELARLDRREPAGSHAQCVSAYGAVDMVGNVDEWVVNETGDPFRSGLKGGYWGPVKNRCRPMTVAHEETFRYYQIGFRCCS